MTDLSSILTTLDDACSTYMHTCEDPQEAMALDGDGYVLIQKTSMGKGVFEHTYMLSTQRYSNMRVAKHVCMFHLSR